MSKPAPIHADSPRPSSPAFALLSGSRCLTRPGSRSRSTASLLHPLLHRSRHQHETASRRTPIRTISRTKTSDEMSVPGHTPRQGHRHGHGQCSAQIGSARWVGVCQLLPRACADYPVLFGPGRDRPGQPRDWNAELLRQMRHDPESGGVVLRGHPPLPARHGGPAGTAQGPCQ
jgi:hypothetical protein